MCGRLHIEILSVYLWLESINTSLIVNILMVGIQIQLQRRIQHDLALNNCNTCQEETVHITFALNRYVPDIEVIAMSKYNDS